jgi:hypothetical protein
MKRIIALVSLLALTGCAGSAPRLTSADNIFSVSPTDNRALVAAIVDAASDVGLPPRSNDASNPDTLTFGGYGAMVMGYTAKVNVSQNPRVAASVHLYTYDPNLSVSMKLADFESAIRHRLESRAKSR